MTDTIPNYIYLIRLFTVSSVPCLPPPRCVSNVVFKLCCIFSVSAADCAVVYIQLSVSGVGCGGGEVD